jgi:protein-disulfide isomerase
MSEVPMIRKRLFLMLGLTGIIVASVAGLSHHLEWLASLCTGFSQGCRETADFNLFRVPLWLWGVGFYLLVSLLAFRGYGLLFWVLAGGFGVELGLMWLMFSLGIVCVFCLANFIVVLALVLCAFERARVWQTLSVALAAWMLSAVLIPYENTPPAPPATTKSPALVAKVAGKPITYDELVLPMASRIYDLEEQVYRLQRERLDQLIAKMVLDREAEQQGKATQELVKAFLASQTIPVEDQEVADYYAENRARWAEWKGTEQELMAQIRAYLQQFKTQQRVMEYAKSLNPRHDVEVYLTEPQFPTIQVRLEQDDPVLGPDNASLTIFEFSDYQCPACRRNHEVVREIRQAYRDRVRWVFKDFPMPGHQWARGAALASHCAAEQGKFWEYQDLLFASQDELSTERLTQLARELDLQMEPFNRCLEVGKFQAHIDRDIEQGKKFGFNTTPTFVINHRVVSGAPPAGRFRQIIDEELEKLLKNS